MLNFNAQRWSLDCAGLWLDINCNSRGLSVPLVTWGVRLEGGLAAFVGDDDKYYNGPQVHIDLELTSLVPHLRHWHDFEGLKLLVNSEAIDASEYIDDEDRVRGAGLTICTFACEPARPRLEWWAEESRIHFHNRRGDRFTLEVEARATPIPSEADTSPRPPTEFYLLDEIALGYCTVWLPPSSRQPLAEARRLIAKHSGLTPPATPRWRAIKGDPIHDLAGDYTPLVGWHVSFCPPAWVTKPADETVANG